MKKFIFFVLGIFFTFGISFAQIRVACIGNSITAGTVVGANNSYPAFLQTLLGIGYAVHNDGVSGTTMLKSGDSPYWTNGMLSDVFSFLPNTITVMLGTNDTKSQNWDAHYQSFKADYEAMIDTLNGIASHPKIWLILPVPVISTNYGINDTALQKILVVIRQIAAKKNLSVIDANTPLKAFPQYFSDGVHPNAAGEDTIAHIVYRALMSPDTGASEDYSQWSKSMQLIINTSAAGYGINSNLAGFPYLVRLGKKDFNFSEANANGNDVRFSNAAGAALAYEIERWDTGSQNAAIWVRVDTIRGNNATQYITMYWGKSDALSRSKGSTVFDTSSGFAGVWQLNTAGAGKRPDATYFNDSALSKGTIHSSGGIIGGCDSFVSANKTYNMVVSGINLANRSFTLMAWSRLDETVPAGNRIIISQGSPVADSGLHFGFNAAAGKYTLRFYNDDLDQAVPFTGGTNWHLVAGSYNASDKKQILYIDGVQDNFRAANSNYVGNGALGIGAILFKTLNTDYFDGTLDEVVIANAVRSPDWIRLCYLTQKLMPQSLPTIRYPNRNIVIAVSSDTIAQMITPIIPVTTGIIDSFAISSALPSYMLFDTRTGIISGLPLDTCTDKTYYVRAYNALGFSQDTISLTVSQQGVSVLKERGKTSTPCLVGVRRAETPKVVFFMPSSAGIRELLFFVYDCRGAIVWSSRLDASRLHSGVQTLGIDHSNGTTISSGVYFLRMMDADPSGRTALTGMIRFTTLR